MATWTELTAAAPQSAELFERRLAETGLALLATLRSDGWPRISPFEPNIHDGKLWIGSMPGSTKSRDLRRDPRCCVHSATADKEVKEGDAKLWGRAVEVTDEAEIQRYVESFKARTGHDLGEMPGGFDLFWLDVTAASGLRVGDDGEHLAITRWREGGSEELLRRR